MVAFFISTFGAILLLFFDSYENWVPLMVLFAKFGMVITLTLCYFANSHIFPAIFCGTAFGIYNIFAKLGTIFAPLVAEVEKPIPTIILGLSTFIVGLLSYFIKEKKEIRN